MNEKKTRIKDLAEKYKVPTSEMLAAAREEGINASNPKSALTFEQVAKIDKRYAKQEESKEVIVRRHTPSEAAKDDSNAAQDSNKQRSGEKKEGNRDRNRSRNRTRNDRNRTPRPEQVSGAKVISRPAAQAEQADTPAPAQEKAAPVTEEKANAVVVEAPAKVVESPAADKAAPATPKVRIISRPTPTASPAPQQNAGARRDGRDTRDSRGPRDGDNRRRDGNRDNRGQQQRQGGNGQGRQGNGQQNANRPQGNNGPRNSQGGAPRQQQNNNQNSGNFRPAHREEHVDFDQPQQLDSRNGQSKKKRNKGRRTTEFQTGDFGHHQEEHDAAPRMRAKPRRKPAKAVAAPTTQPLKAAKRKLRIEGSIRVSDMAHQMGLKSNEIQKVLFNLGIMATINQSIDFDTASLVASEFNYEVEKTGFEEKDYLEAAAPDRPEDLKPRPPVVTIMGHVDHGKTSLLDAIRKTHVTNDEAGGITQHIGAYHVKTKTGDVVFLDTPGHEAFTAMRARGAQVTDLVILVVAADDGVMEQTREAVNHSRAAGVPIIVAINKMDKPSANPDRVIRELAELGLQPEDWGGETIFTKVSAKTRQGLDELLELLALQSEVMELKANPDKPARGHIIEAKLDKGRGPVATVLIQEGTLHQGDSFVCGSFCGRVRALLNDQGKKVREAGPSIPVEVQGFTGVPTAGEEFNAIADERVARRIADARATKQRERELASESKITLETFLASTGDGDQKTLNLVVKADVQGTLEAVQESLKKAGTDKVTVNVVHGGTGAITESDILLASASKAIIIGFNIRPAAKVKDIAVHENVDIRFYDIIYKLVDDVKSAMAGLLAPVEKEIYLGQAEVRQTFSLPKVGTIAGSYVADGKLSRNAGIRLLRDGVVVYTGRISSLKRFKDDAKEVLRGNECGVGLENFNDIKVGDIIEAFETVQEAATL